MEFFFHSQEELYQRVLPVLLLKQREMRYFGYQVEVRDIWEYLAVMVFSYYEGLTLYDVVREVRTVDCRSVLEFLKCKKV